MGTLPETTTGRKTNELYLGLALVNVRRKNVLWTEAREKDKGDKYESGTEEPAYWVAKTGVEVLIKRRTAFGTNLARYRLQSRPVERQLCRSNLLRRKPNLGPRASSLMHLINPRVGLDELAES